MSDNTEILLSCINRAIDYAIDEVYGFMEQEYPLIIAKNIPGSDVGVDIDGVWLGQRLKNISVPGLHEFAKRCIKQRLGVINKEVDVDDAVDLLYADEQSKRSYVAEISIDEIMKKLIYGELPYEFTSKFLTTLGIHLKRNFPEMSEEKRKELLSGCEIRLI